MLGLFQCDTIVKLVVFSSTSFKKCFLCSISVIKETAMFFTAGNVVSAFGELLCLKRNEMLEKHWMQLYQ